MKRIQIYVSDQLYDALNEAAILHGRSTNYHTNVLLTELMLSKPKRPTVAVEVSQLTEKAVEPPKPVEAEAPQEGAVKRGRPPGSKNKPKAAEPKLKTAEVAVQLNPVEDPRITALRTSDEHLFVHKSKNANDETEYIVRLRLGNYLPFEPPGGPYYTLGDALRARQEWTDEDALEWFECKPSELAELRDLILEAESVEGLRNRR